MYSEFKKYPQQQRNANYNTGHYKEKHVITSPQAAMFAYAMARPYRTCSAIVFYRPCLTDSG